VWLEGTAPERQVLPPWSKEAGRAIVGLAEPAEIGPDDDIAVVGCGGVYSRGRITAFELSNLSVEKYIFANVIEAQGLTGPFSSPG
jgi:hypothetical protein